MASYDWVISVSICVVASLISNFGLNLQKLALNMRQTASRPALVYRGVWLCGIVGIAGGAAGDFAALAFGAQSLVAPLGSLTLVANVLMAPWVLKETVTARDLKSTALIVLGCILAVAFASHSSADFTTKQLFELYTRPQFYAYLPIVVVTIIIMYGFIKYVEAIQAKYGICSPEYEKWSKFHRFSYASVSGIAGAQSILFAKSTVSLITNTTRGGTLFLAQGEAYGIICAMILTVTLQIYWLNCGLARWDAVNNVPIFQSFWILVSVVGGGLFYNEFQDFTTLQWIMFPIGIVITVIGVYYLSRRETVRGRRKSILTLVELVELGTHSSPSVSEVTVFQAKEGIATTNPLGLAVPLHAQVKEGVV